MLGKQRKMFVTQSSKLKRTSVFAERPHLINWSSKVSEGNRYRRHKGKPWWHTSHGGHVAPPKPAYTATKGTPRKAATYRAARRNALRAKSMETSHAT